MLQPLLDRSSRRILESYPALERGFALDIPDPEGANIERLEFGSTSRPVVSIIIPACNHVAHTVACLSAVDRHCRGLPVEVIVVDDASTDETAAIVGAIPGVNLIRNPVNAGFVHSCNRGAESARGEYLVFLNNDTLVQRDWLQELLRTVEEQPRAGVVGSQLINGDGSLQEAGGIIWRDGDGWNYGRGGDRRRPEFNYLRATSYCSGASLLVPKAVFQEVGGFDERYAPAYYEDTDLAFAVRSRGYRVLYQPLSRAVHFEGVSSGTDPASGVKRYQLRNREIFHDKWKQVLAQQPAGPPPAYDGGDPECRYRVLVVDAGTPFPDKDSGSVDAYFLLKILRDLSFAVTFMPEDLTYREDYTRDLQRFGVECIYRPFVGDMVEFLRDRGDSYDFVFLTRWHVADRILGAVRRHCRSAKIGFIAVDLHYLRQEREAEALGSWWLKHLARRARRRELAVAAGADLAIVKSESERRLLKKEALPCRTYLLPLIMDIPARRAPPLDERRDFFFLGGFAHPPNVDAVLYMVRDIWPLIRGRLPDVSLHIFGSEMSGRLRSLQADGLKVIGYVRDLAECMNSHRVMVVPLRYGAGIKGKLGRALGYGVPCVATAMAVEGMGLDHGRNVIVADGAQEFADRCVELYTNEELWSRVSANGMAFYEQEFSVTAGRQKVREMMREIGAEL